MCCCFSSRCSVVGIKGERKFDLSLRGSRIAAGVDGRGPKVRDPEVCDLGGLSEGQVVRGYVKAVTDIGVYVR